jgi:hypothetical protein
MADPQLNSDMQAFADANKPDIMTYTKPLLVGVVVGWLAYAAMKKSSQRDFYAIVLAAGATILSHKFIFKPTEMSQS